MSSSFDLDYVDHFTTGTVGPPGQRVFFLQARAHGQLVSLRLEKSQIAALVTYLDALLQDLPGDTDLASDENAPPHIQAEQPSSEATGSAEPADEDDETALDPAMNLVEPAVAEWVVGSMGVSYDGRSDRIFLLAEEMPALLDDSDEETDNPIAQAVHLAALAEIQGATARFALSRDQVRAFARHGARVVAAGRPPCPLCGAPVNADGHMCVRLNGHRRPER